eukprot:TRINITY_DN15988_c0_g1_i1.p1 TRINITY_DN15988_c0_g1~~TRINITY_DN15988_c0_g1_i1.p1  ORF type:complete len:737 (+),score=76.76 TRINITY_DN15988_c0_g1_i1:128-2338(+)
MSLSVTVVKATNLPKADIKGHGDFYVELDYGGEKQLTGTKEGANPEWGEVVAFNGEGSGVLKVEVREKDEFSKDDVIGRCEVQVKDGEETHTVPLKLTNGGDGSKIVLTTVLGPDGTPSPPPPDTDSPLYKFSPDPTNSNAVVPPPTLPVSQDEQPEPVLKGVQGKALLIGINYVGQPNISLTQSVSSVRSLQEVLKAEGFEGTTRILADDGAIDSMPTRRNIEESISWLVSGARPQDALILYYAGRLRREDDGSVGICPADHRDIGDIISRDLISRLKRSVPLGCRVLWILDTPGGGSVSPPSQQPLLPFRVSYPETDLANFSPPSAGTHSGILVLSGSSLEAMVEGAMCTSLIASLRSLRGQAETPLDEAGRLFVKRVHSRFPNLLDPVINGGGYVSQDFAAWGEKSLVDLQSELAAFGVPATRAAPLQNIAQEFFKDPPEDVLVPAPPALSVLMQRLHENHPSTGPNFTILCESDARIDAEAPFLPACAPSTDLSLYTSPQPVNPPSSVVPYTDQHFASSSEYSRYSSSGADTWPSYVGYISTGGDILGSPRLMTISEAIDLARRYPECVGFSLRGENPNPLERTWIYFKNKWDLHGSGWTTYRRPDIIVDMPSSAIRTPFSPPMGVVPVHPRGHGIDPWYRQRLVNFYNHYNPSKLPSVVPTLLEYRGHEDELFRTLAQKYGPEPPDTMADPLAPGWRLVESPQGDLYYKHVDGRKQWERPLDLVYTLQRGY